MWNVWQNDSKLRVQKVHVVEDKQKNERCTENIQSETTSREPETTNRQWNPQRRDKTEDLDSNHQLTTLTPDWASTHSSKPRPKVSPSSGSSNSYPPPPPPEWTLQSTSLGPSYPWIPATTNPSNHIYKDTFNVHINRPRIFRGRLTQSIWSTSWIYPRCLPKTDDQWSSRQSTPASWAWAHSSDGRTSHRLSLFEIGGLKASQHPPVGFDWDPATATYLDWRINTRQVRVPERQHQTWWGGMKLTKSQQNKAGIRMCSLAPGADRPPWCRRIHSGTSNGICSNRRRWRNEDEREGAQNQD